MKTILARFTLFPVILFAGCSPGYAEEQIVPAVGEPIQPIPADSHLDPDKVALGSLLFNDPRLSNDNSLSCASCRRLESGGDDGLRGAISPYGQGPGINTPTVFNARFNFRQFWDGSAETLEQQVDHAINARWNTLLQKLAGDATLARRFSRVYPDGINLSDRDVALIAAFLKTLTGEYNGKPLAVRGGSMDDSAKRQSAGAFDKEAS